MSEESVNSPLTPEENWVEPDFSQPNQPEPQVPPTPPEPGAVLRSLRERLSQQFREDKECLDRAYVLGVSALEGQLREKMKRLDELEATEDLVNLVGTPGVTWEPPSRVSYQPAPSELAPRRSAQDESILMAARHYGGPFTSKELSSALDKMDPGQAPHERGRVKLVLDRFVRDRLLVKQEVETPSGLRIYYQDCQQSMPISQGISVAQARKGRS